MHFKAFSPDGSHVLVVPVGAAGAFASVQSIIYMTTYVIHLFKMILHVHASSGFSTLYLPGLSHLVVVVLLSMGHV